MAPHVVIQGSLASNTQCREAAKMSPSSPLCDGRVDGVDPFAYASEAGTGVTPDRNSYAVARIVPKLEIQK